MLTYDSPNGSHTMYRMRAKDYYGPHAAGSVVIHDGAVALHGSEHEVTEFLKKREKWIRSIYRSAS